MNMKRKYRLIICFLLGLDVLSMYIIRLQQHSIKTWKKTAEKNIGLFMLMNQWVRVKQEGKKLDAYFINNNYQKIAVYGMSYIGLRIIRELKDSEIEIAYGIDKRAEELSSDLKLFTLEDDLPDIDAVVVTLLSEYDEVYEAISTKVNCPVIAIEDIFNEV
ncbi:MAG: hypothetical protein K2L82_03020 [Lachnospiraceae bacterium]|nr:hypothetical protein [Lachnospiraceae bacterium]